MPKLSGSDLYRLYELEREYVVRQSRKNLLTFTRYTKKDYRVNWHHRLLCEYLDRFVNEEIRNLIVFMPPRHGKSELVSRRLPAYLLGKKDNLSLIACSYSTDLAGFMNRDVQRIMDTPEYASIFPGVSLSTAHQFGQGQRVRNSEVFETSNGGVYKSAGVGGGITGLGANYCFPSGVDISAYPHNKDISKIEVGDSVWTLNHESGLSEIKKVKNVFRRSVSRLVQITSNDRREVLCTPEHPFYTERQEYRQAKDLKGLGVIVLGGLPKIASHGRDSSMLSLPKRIFETAIRLREIFKTWTSRIVLFESMFEKTPQFQEQKKMCWLRQTSRKETQKILQPGLCPTSESKSINPITIQEYLSENSCFDRIARRFRVFSVQREKKSDGAPHQQRQARRFNREFDNDMSSLPFKTPQIQKDTISSITEISDGKIVDVYDIEVEGNHNFFANGFLVHNCIVDDPIKNQEEASSQVIRDKVWEWYTSTLYTRLQAPRSVLVTLTRWHEDDLAGRLLQLSKQDAAADQWTILRLPARHEFHDRHPQDPRKEGEPLWPSDFGDNILTSIQASVGPSVWSALYQQSPTPASGGFFNADMFQFCEVLPQPQYTFITGDTSYKEKQENDYTVFAAWGYANEQLFLFDVFRERIKASESEAIAETFIRKHSKFGFRGAYIEPKGHGIYLNQKFRQRGIMLPTEERIIEFYKDRRLDKKERASNVIPYLTNKKVFISNAIRCKDEVLSEALSFPKGTHDDFVDCLVDALKVVYDNHKASILNVLGRVR